MVVVVLALEVVDVAGPDERAPHFTGDLDDPLVRTVLVGEAVLLDLEVDVVLTKRADQLVGVVARRVHLAVQQVLAEARLQAARQGNDALRVTGDLREIERRLAALVALEEAGRGELDEIAVAGRGGREQREMVALEPAGRPAGMVLDDVHLAAEDRLDVVLAARREQLNGSVHHAVIGQSEGRLFERGGPGGELLDLARSVE